MVFCQAQYLCYSTMVCNKVILCDGRTCSQTYKERLQHKGRASRCVIMFSSELVWWRNMLE